MQKKSMQDGPCCRVNLYAVLNSYYFKVPAESPNSGGVYGGEGVCM